MREKLRQLRVQKGLSQDEMALRMNKSTSAYQRWEAGSTLGTLDDYLLASQILECRMEVLIDEAHLAQNMNDVSNSTFANVQHLHTDKSTVEIMLQMMETMQKNQKALFSLILKELYIG
jgi:transcriptional regulator with XRE-family HTH domain